MPLSNDSKRYFWIKLKTNFLTSKRVDFLMRQNNGSDYVTLYQSLCLLTANTHGQLADFFDDFVSPWSPEKIQGLTKNWFSLDTIKSGLALFKKMRLSRIDEKGVICIAEFEDIVGSESGAAARMRESRQASKSLSPEGEQKGEQKENNVHQDNRE